MVEPAGHVAVSPCGEILGELLAAAARHGERRAWVALDLDGTLFDNRPRTLAILRAFSMARQTRWPQLAQVVSSLGAVDLRYSPTHALEAAGLDDADLSEDFLPFWRERFFTNTFQLLDAVEPGAVAFARALCAAGLGVVYLTGRDRPGMMLGVLQALDGHGFPLMTAQTQVVLKPDFATGDLEFKRTALRELGRNGPVVGLVDNEPAIVNMALASVPGIVSVRMCRAFAPDPPELDGRARQIVSFECQDAETPAFG